jgi:hypothetical protein
MSPSTHLTISMTTLPLNSVPSSLPQVDNYPTGRPTVGIDVNALAYVSADDDSSSIMRYIGFIPFVVCVFCFSLIACKFSKKKKRSINDQINFRFGISRRDVASDESNYPTIKVIKSSETEYLKFWNHPTADQEFSNNCDDGDFHSDKKARECDGAELGSLSQLYNPPLYYVSGNDAVVKSSSTDDVHDTKQYARAATFFISRKERKMTSDFEFQSEKLDVRNCDVFHTNSASQA